jgi:hypothetical protein
MFLPTSNKPRQLLCLNYVGHVRVEDLAQRRDEVLALLADLPAGFRLLTDLSLLREMDVNCEAEISWMMEIFDRKGMSVVIRVIPEPQKDIGFKILAAFHYKRRVRNITCGSMEEALRLLLSAAEGTPA